MKIQVVKTRKFLPPKDNLWNLISKNIKSLEEKSILVITSKVVSISEGRCVKITPQTDRDELAKKEAQLFLPRDFVPGKWFLHTIKNNLLVASAGIDKSNAGDYFILWPENPGKSAKKIHGFLSKKYKVKNIGVIITDSHSVPLHRGLVGIAISYFGFQPLRDYRGKKDIFGNKLLMSQTNIPDSLAAAAVFSMGEGAEQTPIAIISDIESKVKFVEGNGRGESFEVPFKKDLFYPFLKSVKWKKGGNLPVGRQVREN